MWPGGQLAADEGLGPRVTRCTGTRGSEVAGKGQHSDELQEVAGLTLCPSASPGLWGL